MRGRWSSAARRPRRTSAWTARSLGPRCVRKEGAETPMAEFDPRAIFDVLERHGIRYVVIGGVAAILHGAAHVTTDVDVVPQDARDNLERLSDALNEIHARIRVSGEPDGVPFDHSAEALARVRILEPSDRHRGPRRHVRTLGDARLRRPQARCDRDAASQWERAGCIAGRRDPVERSGGPAKGPRGASGVTRPAFLAAGCSMTRSEQPSNTYESSTYTWPLSGRPTTPAAATRSPSGITARPRPGAAGAVAPRRRPA